MAKWVSATIIALSVIVGVPAAAQSAVQDPEHIPIPEGFSLVEVPAKFETVREPIPPKTQELMVGPPVYGPVLVDGKIVRGIIQPGRTYERLSRGPVEFRLVRKIKFPISYGVTDGSGNLVARWAWKDGELTKTDIPALIKLQSSQ